VVEAEDRPLKREGIEPRCRALCFRDRGRDDAVDRDERKSAGDTLTRGFSAAIDFAVFRVSAWGACVDTSVSKLTNEIKAWVSTNSDLDLFFFLLRAWGDSRSSNVDDDDDEVDDKRRGAEEEEDEDDVKEDVDEFEDEEEDEEDDDEESEESARRTGSRVTERLGETLFWVRRRRKSRSETAAKASNTQTIWMVTPIPNSVLSSRNKK